jgi:hypothetical protein
VRRRAEQRTLRCRDGERRRDETSVDFVEGRIYSTVGYVDTALVQCVYTDV